MPSKRREKKGRVGKKEGILGKGELENRADLRLRFSENAPLNLATRPASLHSRLVLGKKEGQECGGKGKE